MKKNNLSVAISCSGKFHAFALAEQLQKNNVLETFYNSYAYQKNIAFRKLAKRIDKEDINITKIKTNILIAIGSKILPNHYFWNNLYDKWVARQLKKSDANVFIGWSGMSLHSIRAARKKEMITIVERGSSHILFQNEILKEEYKKFGKEFSINQKVINKEIKEYEEADYISIPSKYVQKTFLDKKINSNKLFLNNYGTSFSQTNIKLLNTNKDKFTILYLGALTIQKGMIYLFEALQNLQIHPNKFEVHFIGTVAEELKSIVEKYKKPNWIFFGQIQYSDLTNYITKTDVAIQPSLQEGLSMVIPQILSCGIPVIATTNTGGGDIITDGKNGYIIPIRDSDSIKEKLENLFYNNDLLNEMKANATNLKDLSWDEYGNRYINFLKSKTI